MRRLLAVLLFSFSLPLIAGELSLYDEDLKQFSSWVASQTGETIIISSGIDSVLVNVDGKYNGNRGLLDLYRSVLTANGLQLVKDSGFYRVVKASAPASLDSDKEKVLRIVDLAHVHPEALIAALDGFKLSDVSVASIPNSSSVSFYGDPELVNRLLVFAKAFDVKPRQVLIEAVVMETNNSDSESVGVFLRSRLSESGFSASSNTSTRPMGFDMKGGVLAYLTGGDIRLFVNLIRSTDDVSILSEPKLVSLDREEAYMTVGQNVPFITSTQSTDGGGIVQAIERRDVGLSIRVMPVVVGNEIRLSIFQEISNVTNSTAASDIVTNQRALRTVARVKSGDSIVIGGLVSKESQDLLSKVPVLGDVPVLGKAFRSTEGASVSRELQLLIRATVL